MADDHYTHGAMDISQNQRSYAGFVGFVKYSLAFILLVLIFLAVFRTHG
ncbi:MAG: aa3-type cytochrome c oxidase subunit IV [Rhizomicrobium sp.]